MVTVPWRHLPPVHSPIRPTTLLRGLGRAIGGWLASEHDALAELLRVRYAADTAVLTDSGTSALVLALRLVVRQGGTVAFPAYACIDLAAAARYADVRVRLYDIDPATLSPDLRSLESALGRGVDAVLVAHLYGMPADVAGAMALARLHGVPVIEDAAQIAGARRHGAAAGAEAPLTVLSFGRGKGTTAGNGGALLAREGWSAIVAKLHGSLAEGWGWRDLAGAGAQWILARPSLYAVPSAVPGLRLGEMIYHPAHEPRGLTRVAATLARQAISEAAHAVERRRQTAVRLRELVARSRSLTAIEPLAGAEPGFLRFPVQDRATRSPDPVAGILRGYPRTLMEQEELRPLVHDQEREHTGALELRRSLFTLPTHEQVRACDERRIAAWVDGAR